ncbi:uncharacterized protein METZ01_LOCUS12971, partial [marine metagenome]
VNSSKSRRSTCTFTGSGVIGRPCLASVYARRPSIFFAENGGGVCENEPVNLLRTFSTLWRSTDRPVRDSKPMITLEVDG